MPDGAIGPWAQQLLDEVIAKSPSDNPFDLADTMQNVLLSSEFSYNTDLTDVNCEPSAVECFARIKGVLPPLRVGHGDPAAGRDPGKPIPTRLVEGFLPGEINGTTSTVRIRDAHAWVEVYFPGFGWIPFDPTKQVGLPDEAHPGPARAAARRCCPRRASAAATPADPTPEGRRSRRGPSPAAAATGPTAASLLTVFAVILAAGVVALAFAAWLRGPRNEVGPDGAWRSMERTAKRLGFGPRPTQTVYEYASVLGTSCPSRSATSTRSPTAKVETSYAGAKLPARGSTRSVRRPAGSGSRCSASRSAGRGAAGAPDRRAVGLERPGSGPLLRLLALERLVWSGASAGQVRGPQDRASAAQLPRP